MMCMFLVGVIRPGGGRGTPVRFPGAVAYVNPATPRGAHIRERVAASAGNAWHTVHLTGHEAPAVGPNPTERRELHIRARAARMKQEQGTMTKAEMDRTLAECGVSGMSPSPLLDLHLKLPSVRARCCDIVDLLPGDGV